MSTDSSTVLVTGASSGIGLAIAKAYLQQGANVVMNAYNPDKLKQAAAGLNKVVLVPGDIGKKSTGEKMVEAAVSNFGSIDLLVNNAGRFIAKPLLDYSEDDVDALLNTNLKGTFFTSQAVVRQMRKQKKGVIINIGAATVLQPSEGLPCSAAMTSKAGVHSLTTTLAIELASDNIRVNAVAPMIIRTPMHDPTTVDNLSAIHPLKRIGEVQDIVDAVMYLANANFVTGVVLPVDGGFSAGRQ